MIIKLKSIILLSTNLNLCIKSYPGHSRGCPNYNHKKGCPPLKYRFNEKTLPPYYAIINEFNLAKHVARMKSLHPQWSERQLVCCLYWQQTARKQLQSKINEFLNNHNYIVDTCPEASGVNVTQTLQQHGIELEWPPRNIVRQVAIAY
jgi:predicted metal-binding protein